MNRRILLCLLALTVGLALGLLSAAIAGPKTAVGGVLLGQQATTQNSEPKSFFSGLLAVLQQKTRIPIKLPQYVPDSDDEENPLYAILEITQADRYSIQLAWLTDCDGGNACHVGYVGGSKAPFPRGDKPALAVKLADNIVGTFYNFDCGAHCDDASLNWRQGGYYYGISLKAGDKQTLMRMANSAIRPTENRKLRSRLDIFQIFTGGWHSLNIREYLGGLPFAGLAKGGLFLFSLSVLFIFFSLCIASIEPTVVQAFIPQPRMKTLHTSVLPWLSRLNGSPATMPNGLTGH